MGSQRAEPISADRDRPVLRLNEASDQQVFEHLRQQLPGVPPNAVRLLVLLMKGCSPRTFVERGDGVYAYWLGCGLRTVYRYRKLLEAAKAIRCEDRQEFHRIYPAWQRLGVARG